MSGRADYLKASGDSLEALFGGIVTSRQRPDGQDKEENDIEAVPAFGYLRGLSALALTLEVRFRDGNRDYFPYSHLAGWRFNPSVGLLLKWTADVVSVVLVRGSNLDVPVNPGAINLTDRGIARQRIVWIREMDEDDLRRAGEGQPSIDRITVAEFETNDDLREWLKKSAPVFLR